MQLIERLFQKLACKLGIHEFVIYVEMIDDDGFSERELLISECKYCKLREFSY